MKAGLKTAAVMVGLIAYIGLIAWAAYIDDILMVVIAVAPIGILGLVMITKCVYDYFKETESDAQADATIRRIRRELKRGGWKL